MVNHAVPVALTAALAPPLTPIIEAALISYELICQRLRTISTQQNAELCDLLAAFQFRVKSEVQEGGVPTTDWATRLDALFRDVSTYVDACEEKSDLRLLFSAIDRQKQVKKLRKEIECLESTMNFRHV